MLSSGLFDGIENEVEASAGAVQAVLDTFVSSQVSIDLYKEIEGTFYKFKLCFKRSTNALLSI
jgi:hypothetical protein